MKVENLNQTAILIDVDFLCKLIMHNYSFYRDFLPWKELPNLKITDIIRYIAVNGRIHERGHKVDVILYYNPAHRILPFSQKPNNIAQFLDFTKNDYFFETDEGIFYLRSYFSDTATLEWDIEDQDAFNYKYMEGFRQILNKVVHTDSICHIVLFADNEYLNEDLNSYMKLGKFFYIERDHSSDTHYDLEIEDIGKYYYVDANYVIAYSMGLSNSEI